MWEYLSNELKKDIENSIQLMEKGELMIKKEYNKAVNHLTDLIKEQLAENSAGNYLSRIEVDEYIFKSFAK